MGWGCFDGHHFVDASLVTSAFEIGGEECFDGIERNGGPSDVGAEAEDVCIVVSSRHFGFVGVVDERGADAVDFVCGH